MELWRKLEENTLKYSGIEEGTNIQGPISLMMPEMSREWVGRKLSLK